MRRMWLLIGVAALVLSGAAPAMAEPPVRVEAQVTDLVGALEAGRPAVDDALRRLQAEGGTRLFVLFVAGFDATSATDWAAEVAALSSLGESDALIAVAVDDGAYEWWIGDAFPLPSTEVSALLATEVEPRLGTGDWAGIAVATAEGVRARLAGGPAPAPQVPTSQVPTLQVPTLEDSAPQRQQWSAGTTAVVGVAVLVSLVGGHLLSRRKSRLPSASATGSTESPARQLT